MEKKLFLWSIVLVFALAYVMPCEFDGKYFVSIGYPVRFFKLNMTFPTQRVITSASLNLVYLAENYFVVYWVLRFSIWSWEHLRGLYGAVSRKFFRKNCDDQEANNEQ